MAAYLKNRIIDGEIAQADQLGFTVHRTVVVYNLTIGSIAYPGSLIVTKDNIQNVAVQFVQSNHCQTFYGTRYAYGDQHPGIPYCFVSDYRTRLLSLDVVEVDITFTGFVGYSKVQFSSGLDSAETHQGYYKTGANSYESTKSDMYTMIQGDTSSKTGHLINVSVPVIQISVEQNEISAFDAMNDKIWMYTGKLNQGPFIGYPEGTVLCQSINADRVFGYGPTPQYTPNSGFGFYSVRYIFAYKSGWLAWDTLLVHTESDTGRPPATVTSGYEKRQYRLYDTIAFGQLGENLGLRM